MQKVYDRYVPKPRQSSTVPEGAYVLKVLDMHDHPDKEYIACVWDIAEGEYAGKYSDPDFNKGNSWRGHCLYLSYKSEFSLHHVSQWLDAIRHSNNGFNSTEAWNEICDQEVKDFSPFIGKLFGAGIKDDTYDANGTTFTQSKVDIPTIADFVRSGKFKGRGRHA